MKQPSSARLAAAALTAVAGAALYALSTLCFYDCQAVPVPPDQALLAGGLITAALLLAAAGRGTGAHAGGLLMLAVATIGSAAALTVELRVAVLDPYGPQYGSYVPDGLPLALYLLVALGLPALIAVTGPDVQPDGRPPGRRVPFGLLLAALVAATGVTIGLASDAPASVSIRAASSERHAYRAVLPPRFRPGGSFGLFLGSSWSLPTAFDWYDGWAGNHRAQLAVWSTPLPPEMGLGDFGAWLSSVDAQRGFGEPLGRDGPAIDGRQAAWLRYRTTPTPKIDTTGCVIMMSCDTVRVWSDCRFFLSNLRSDVDVVRLLFVERGRAYILSGFVAEGGRQSLEPLVATFADTLVTTAGPPPADVLAPVFPDTAPMTTQRPEC